MSTHQYIQCNSYWFVCILYYINSVFMLLGQILTFKSIHTNPTILTHAIWCIIYDFNMIDPILWLRYLAPKFSNWFSSQHLHVVKFDLHAYTSLHFHITYTFHICRYLHSVVGVRTWWEYKLRQSAFRRTVKLFYTLPLYVHFTDSLALVAIDVP